MTFETETLHISQLMYLLRGLQWQSSKGVWQWRWAAHITFIMFYLKLAPTPAFDRLTCYGTSYASDFHDTHCYPVQIALIQWVTQNENKGKNHLPVLKIRSWNLRIDPLFSGTWRILYMKGFQALPKGSSIIQVALRPETATRIGITNKQALLNTVQVIILYDYRC